MKKMTWLVLFVGCSNVYAQLYPDPLQKHRENYIQELIEDGPLEAADSSFVDFYAADESFIVECKFVATKRGKPFEIPTSSGETKTYSKFGEIRFTMNGEKQKLAVYRSLDLMNNPLYRDYLFIPFKDLTNGSETYGGGRYLDLRMREMTGNTLTLDFNKAYNPYCAFSDGFSCPIPPVENHLKINIAAGEKNYKKGH